MKKWQLILFIVGMAFLGILTVLSLIGAIYACFPPFNSTLFTVLSSTFISALSAILTVGALLVTIIHNNKIYNLELEKHEIATTQVLNHINETLILNKVEICQYLQGKAITDRNICVKEVKANKLQIKFYFNSDELSNIKSMGIRQVKQFIRTDKSDCPHLTVKVKSDPIYKEIHRVDEKTFYYEMITNIDYEVFEKFRQYLLGNGNCEIGAYLDFDIMDVSNRKIKCKKGAECKFIRLDTARNEFLFERI